VARWGVIADELAPWVERHGWDPGADAYARLTVLMGLWQRYGEVMNLHGARTRDDLVRHVQDGLETALCAAKTCTLTAETQWLDVGSGGGFPALVVAAATGCAMTAVEPRQKRAGFLELAFAAIESKSSRVIRARLEDSTWNEEFGGSMDGRCGRPFCVATARAVWAPAEWLELGKNLVSRPGAVIVHGIAGRDPRAFVDGTFSRIEAYCFT
jgi:16S rRNA (guanine527-N7)-methyltransferase